MLVKIENQVRQQLFGMISLFVVGLMVLNSLGVLVYGDSNQTNLAFNVSSGSFSISNTPTAMNFTGQTFGTGNNIVGSPDIDGSRVTDYRGNVQAWAVVVNASNLTDGTNVILPNKLTLFANQIVFTNVQNFTTSRVNKGANGTLNDSGFSMVNGSTQASGIVQFDNGFVNLFYNGSDAAGDYAGNMIYTLS